MSVRLKNYTKKGFAAQALNSAAKLHIVIYMVNAQICI